MSDNLTEDRIDARFTRRVGSFTIGTLISRIMGLVRESVFAFLFGAGFATDAFNAAFRIPNLLRDLFAESALSAAFVPTFVENLTKKDRKEVWRFASNMFNTMVIFVGLIVILGIIFSPLLVKVIAMGFGKIPGKQELTMTLTRIMFPFLLFVSLAAWAMGILNALGSFFIPAVAPAFFNLFSIIVPVITYHYLTKIGVNPILGMAYGVTIGAIIQFLVQLPSLMRRGFHYEFYLNLNDPQLRRVFFLWLPMILGFASFQINFAINTFLVAFLEERSMTYLNYAYRVMHLPAGLFGVAIGGVALAEFSRAISQDSIESLKFRLRHSLNLVVVLTIPISVLLFALASPVCRLIYQHGKFTAQDTTATAQALMLYALGVPFAAAARSVAACFYSLKDTKTPPIVGMIIVGLNTVMNLSLMWFLRFLSFPITTSTAALVNFFLLLLILRRRIGPMGYQANLVLTLKVSAISALSGLFAFLVSQLLLQFLGHQTIVNQILQVFFAGGLGLIVFYLLSLIFRINEVRTALTEFLSRPAQVQTTEIINKL
ncbi:MAG: murein biosynthesis integral membrane protein MurJ [candidate division WOR-3 bacterium]